MKHQHEMARLLQNCKLVSFNLIDQRPAGPHNSATTTTTNHTTSSSLRGTSNESRILISLLPDFLHCSELHLTLSMYSRLPAGSGLVRQWFSRQGSPAAQIANTLWASPPTSVPARLPTPPTTWRRPAGCSSPVAVAATRRCRLSSYR